jgi:hypothetical protein
MGGVGRSDRGGVPQVSQIRLVSTAQKAVEPVPLGRAAGRGPQAHGQEREVRAQEFGPNVHHGG